MTPPGLEALAAFVAGLLLGRGLRVPGEALVGSALLLGIGAWGLGWRRGAGARRPRLMRQLTLAAVLVAGVSRSPAAGWPVGAAAGARQAAATEGAPGAGGHPLGRALGEARAKYELAASRHLSGSVRALYLGMVLGQRQDLPPDLREAVARAGLVHLLVVSGLNVGFVALVAFTLVRLLGCGRRAAALLSFPPIIFYAALTVGGPPVLRATVMTSVVVLGSVSERRTPVLHSLAVSALALLVISPGLAADLSFRLSYLSVAALVLLGPGAAGAGTSARARPGGPASDAIAVRCARGAARYVRDGLHTTAAAQLGVLPLLLALDGRVSLVSPVANLVAVPLAALAVPLGLVLPLIDAISPACGGIWSGGLWLLLAGVEQAARISARVPWGTLVLGSPPAASFPCYYAGLGILAWGGRRWRPAGVAVLAAALALMSFRVLAPRGGALPESSGRVTLVNVGQGEACLLESSQGGAILVDGGPAAGDWDAGRNAILPLLRRRGIRRLDLVVLTHPHDDHAGGLPAVLRSLPVSALVDAGEIAASAAYLETLCAAREKGVRYRVPRSTGVLWDDGTLRLRLIRTVAAEAGSGGTSVGGGSSILADLNEASLAMVASVEGQEAVLCGDLGRRALDRLVPLLAPTPRALLAVPHHGSRASLSPAFLARSRPRWAVVSAARRNRWGFPHPETLRGLAGAGAETWITGESGTLSVEMGVGGCELRDRQGVVVASWRGGRTLDALRPR